MIVLEIIRCIKKWFWALVSVVSYHFYPTVLSVHESSHILKRLFWKQIIISIAHWASVSHHILKWLFWKQRTSRELIENNSPIAFGMMCVWPGMPNKLVFDGFYQWLKKRIHIAVQYGSRCNIDSFLLNKKGLEEVSKLHKNFCNMHIARRNRGQLYVTVLKSYIS